MDAIRFGLGLIVLLASCRGGPGRQIAAQIDDELPAYSLDAQLRAHYLTPQALL